MMPEYRRKLIRATRTLWGATFAILLLTLTIIVARDNYRRDNAVEFESQPKFLIGQRVIVCDEIGTVHRPIPDVQNDSPRCIWVYLPSKKQAFRIQVKDVKPLPNGQL